MKTLISTGLCMFLVLVIHAQNVGVNTSNPLTKLHVVGDFSVTIPYSSTTQAPTVAQTKNMVNANAISYTAADSTGRFYDPGGPAANYPTNQNCQVSISSSLPGIQPTAYIEIKIESIKLAIGASLTIYAGTNPSSPLVVKFGSQNAVNTGNLDFIVQSPSAYIVFASGNAVGTDEGFSILFKKRYFSQNTAEPKVVGNAFVFNSGKGSFRSGLIPDTSVGKYSASIGHSSTGKGDFSIAVGQSNTASGNASSAFGGSGTASGDYSTAIGFSNTAKGVYSLATGAGSTATGEYAIAMGDNAYASGYACLAIGMYNDSLVSTQNSAGSGNPMFIIGNGEGSSSRSNAMVVLKSGNVGIGTNTPRTKFHVNNGTDADYTDGSGYAIFGSIASTNLVIDNNEILARNNGAASNLYLQIDGGNVVIGDIASPSYQLQLSTNSAAKPTSGLWTIASDARLKTNVHDYNDGLAKLLNIHPVWFTYTGEAGMPRETGVGILAQELQQTAPYMVGSFTYKDKDGNQKDYLNVDGGPMIYMLINAVKEQQQMITKQQAQIENLLKVVEKGHK